MRIFATLGVIFYAIITVALGVALIMLSLNLLQPQDIDNFMTLLLNDPNSKSIAGLSGLLLMLLGYSFAQLILGRFQREKTIAFKTASGEVTIALAAIEDLIKRLTGVIPEIKELRPDVRAVKKGGPILVNLRVTLRSEANIPELTERLQIATKEKIEEVLGVEEQIIIKIHVAKIAGIEDKNRREKTEPMAPFSGYGKIN